MFIAAATFLVLLISGESGPQSVSYVSLPNIEVCQMAGPYFVTDMQGRLGEGARISFDCVQFGRGG